MANQYADGTTHGELWIENDHSDSDRVLLTIPFGYSGRACASFTREKAIKVGQSIIDRAKGL